MSQSFWAWPGSGHLARFGLLFMVVSIWWALLFGGANFITTLHAYRVRLHLDAELAIPFVPASVLVYLSINVIFAMTPFVLRTSDELARLTGTLMAVILVASLCFLFFPGAPHFRTPDDLGGWKLLVEFAKRLALKHNFAPSLHVALSTVCLIVFARQAPTWLKLVLAGWGLAIGVSTLLLHQHYVIDVITGCLLGWAGVRLVYDRLPTIDEEAERNAPANPSSAPERPA